MAILNGSNDVRVSITTQADTSGITKTQAALGGLSTESEASTKHTGNMDSAFGSFGRTVGKLGLILAAVKLAEYLKDFGVVGLNTAAQLQQTNQGFQTLIGNTQIANKLFGQLVQYANVTPFESKDITGAARTLLGFGQTADQTYDTIKKLGDVAGATGADFQSLSLVTGQIFAQGTIHAQDFYQIINSGAGALGPLIAKNLGLDGVGSLKKAFEAGEVTSEAFFKALTQATSQGGFAFQGAEKQAQTFNGRLSTLKDAASQAGMALLGVKVDPELGYQVQQGGLFDRMSNGLVDVTNGLSAAVPKIMEFFGSVKEVALLVASFLGPSLEALWHTFEDKLAPSLARFVPYLKFGAEVIGVALVGALWIAINVLNVLANVMSWLGQVVANTGQWFVDRWYNIASVWGQSIGLFQGIAGAIKGAFRDAFNFVASAWNATVGHLSFKIPSWVPELGGKGWDVPDIPHFYNGVKNFKGGMAVVGDVMGGSGEIVSLPKGTDVYTNRESRQMMKQGGGMSPVFNIYNNVDLDAAVSLLSWKMAAR